MGQRFVNEVCFRQGHVCKTFIVSQVEARLEAMMKDDNPEWQSACSHSLPDPTWYAIMNVATPITQQLFQSKTRASDPLYGEHRNNGLKLLQERRCQRFPSSCIRFFADFCNSCAMIR